MESNTPTSICELDTQRQNERHFKIDQGVQVRSLRTAKERTCVPKASTRTTLPQPDAASSSAVQEQVADDSDDDETAFNLAPPAGLLSIKPLAEVSTAILRNSR